MQAVAERHSSSSLILKIVLHYYTTAMVDAAGPTPCCYKLPVLEPRHPSSVVSHE